MALKTTKVIVYNFHQNKIKYFLKETGIYYKTSLPSLKI